MTRLSVPNNKTNNNNNNKAYTLDTNLSDLPLSISTQLRSCLNDNGTWHRVLESEDRNFAFFSSPDEIAKVSNDKDPASAILQRWGNRGVTVHSLISRLQNLSHRQSESVVFDRPQLIFKRKFLPVQWASDAKPMQIIPNEERQEIAIIVDAVGFPSPQFQWLRDGEPVERPGNRLLLNKCKCEADFVYTCRVWNEVEDGQIYSAMYRAAGKQFSSEILSEPVDLTSYIQGQYACDRCKSAEQDKIRQKLEWSTREESTARVVSEQVAAACEKLVAADKVALIISNCTYHHLPQLITPHCDAETLAGALQELHFKTVTLADLTLDEMKEMIAEYKRLLGNDVYAVLYFAGHGFEVNGQCYLLPVEAPMEAHDPSYCLSMDWVQAQLTGVAPALHLFLLDVCRKFIPRECVPKFIEEAEVFKKKHKPNRNTVYGFSTSTGVGAYEVRGERNGVFMGVLKRHVTASAPVIEMLQRVFVDVEMDGRVRSVQIPELRSTLTKPRSLRDELVCDGHTASFDTHNVHWTLMHELPSPAYVRFEEQQLMVIIWFDYCGKFTNKVYAFSSVEPLRAEDSDEDSREGMERALAHRAHLKFPQELEMSNLRELIDEEEGVSLSVMLSHLQKSKGPLECTVELRETATQRVVATRDAQQLGDVLITKIRTGLRRS